MVSPKKDNGSTTEAVLSETSSDTGKDDPAAAAQTAQQDSEKKSSSRSAPLVTHVGPASSTSTPSVVDKKKEELSSKTNIVSSTSQDEDKKQVLKEQATSPPPSDDRDSSARNKEEPTTNDAVQDVEMGSTPQVLDEEDLLAVPPPLARGDDVRQVSQPGAFREEGIDGPTPNENDHVLPGDTPNDNSTTANSAQQPPRRASLWDRLRGQNRRSTGPYLVTATLVPDDDDVHRNNNNVQSAATMNNNDSSNMDTAAVAAVAVPTASGTSGGGSADVDKGVVVHAVQINRKRRRWIFVGLAIVVVVAIILAVTLRIDADGGDHMGGPTQAPTFAPTSSPTMSPTHITDPFGFKSQHVAVWGDFTTCGTYNLSPVELRCTGNGTSTLSVVHSRGADCTRVANDTLSCQLNSEGIRQSVGGVAVICAANDPPLHILSPTNETLKFDMRLTMANSTASDCTTLAHVDTVLGRASAFLHVGRFCWNNQSLTEVDISDLQPSEYQSFYGCLDSQAALVGTSATPDGIARGDMFCYQSGTCSSNTTSQCDVPLPGLYIVESPYGGDYTQCVTPMESGASRSTVLAWLDYAIGRRQSLLSDNVLDVTGP